MPLKTRVTEMLGIEHPLVMGGLTGVGTVELAAAVSNAGGLGMFTAHNAGSPEGARREIRRLKTLTSKPFGVNLTVLPTIGPPPPYLPGSVCMRVFTTSRGTSACNMARDGARWREMARDARGIMIER